jgi:hypothetical protein
VFTIGILIDTSDEPVPRASLDVALAEADTILLGLTGFRFQVQEVSEVAGGGSMSQIAQSYLARDATPPNGLVIFSFGDEDRARTYGGYSFWTVGPSGFRNSFISPVAGDRHIYVAVLHWSHRYARCGYGDGETPVSSASIDGECFNQPGTACTEHGGYSMCSSAIGDLYASTPTYFVAANIVHEFMHPFGLLGVQDHYGTPECIAAMGWGSSGWTASREEAQHYVGMCPNIFETFASAWRP